MKPHPLSLPLAALLALAAPAAAQKKAPEPAPGDRMIEQYLAKEAARLGERFLDGATTLAEWQQRRPRLKQEYLDMLGLWPLPEKTPLHATVTGTLERDDFVIDKLHFQSRPGLYVTGNLYRPKKASGKLPAVLYVCGHSNKGRDGNKTAYQDHGKWFATNGYVCLVIDTLQLGEIPGIHHGTYREGRWWWQAAGYTPAGVECWNGVRAIDYLLSRPDVDADRLAVTGISGGGAATFWIAAADERVKCAVPVSGMSDLESYVTNKVINGHCDCMFLVNTYQWEWTTIAALVAPRPLLFANSDNDPIFPMDGNRRIIARLRQLYALYGKPGLVDDYVSKGGHAYRPDLRVAIFRWINKHVKGDAGPVKDVDFAAIEGKELRVFPEDRDVPRDAINGTVDEVFVPRAQVKLPEAGAFEDWKSGLMSRIRARCFRPFPERLPAAEVSGGRFLGLSMVSSITEAPIELEPHLSRKIDKTEKTFWLLALNEGDEAAELKEARRIIGRDPYVRLAPRGTGSTTWTRKSPPNYVERAHALLGRTVDLGRVWDIATTVRGADALLRDSKVQVQWKVIGSGRAGVLAAYAALFEPTIAEIVIIDPPASHRDGPIFLNILRELDIPEALGMLAPRPLTLVNARDKAFDRCAEIYKAAGAADKFQRK